MNPTNTNLLYSPLKLFNYPKSIEALKNSTLVAPIQIRIKPINACNHNCWFCAYRAEGLSLGDQMKLKDRMPIEKMDEIVRDSISMGVKSVTFSGGGEPLIYTHLATTIQSLANGKIKVGALSNGSFLKNEIADAFANYATWIRISMDGWDSSSYVQSRGVNKNEYENIISNISSFAKRSTKCLLGVSFIINHENYSHILGFCKKMKDIGVKSVKLSGCITSNSGEETNKFHQPFYNLAKEQIDESKKLCDNDFEINDHYHWIEENFYKPYKQCHFLKLLTVIGADCKVYTCQDKAYTHSGLLGSIKNQSFKDFWFSDENKQKMKSIVPCTACNHHCVSNKKNILLEEFLHLNPNHIEFV